MTSKDWSGNVNSVWKTLGASNHTESEREAASSKSRWKNER